LTIHYSQGELAIVNCEWAFEVQVPPTNEINSQDFTSQTTRLVSKKDFTDEW